MKKLAVIFANGMEEIEALTPVDVLRRAGVVCDTVALDSDQAVGSHNIVIKADKSLSKVNLDEYDGIVIPGGMPGATNISDSQTIIDALGRFIRNGKLVCALCASPAVVLAKRRLIDGFKATCYPAPQFIELMKYTEYTADDVTVCKNLITGNGPKSAMKFSLAICDYLGLIPKF